MTRKQKVITVFWFIIVFIIAMCLGGIIHILISDEPMELTPVESQEPQEYESISAFYYDIPLDTCTQDFVRTTSEFYGVPSELMFAIIQCESGFNADAISSTHDYGLMQINVINLERLQEELGITDILDPIQNVLCGIHLFAEHYYNSDKDIAVALLKYNCGVTGANELMSQGIYTTRYTEKILAAYEQFKGSEL